MERRRKNRLLFALTIAGATSLVACEFLLTYDDAGAPAEAGRKDGVTSDAADAVSQDARDTGSMPDGQLDSPTDSPGECKTYPAPTTLYSEQIGARALTFDDASLYWLVGAPDAAGSVVQGDKSGAKDASVLVPNAGVEPSALTVDGARAYWASGAGAVASVPKAGGAVKSLGMAPGRVTSLAVDAKDVYGIVTRTTATAVLSVFRLPIAGGTATQIATGRFDPQAEPVLLNATNVYWVDESTIQTVPKTTDGSVSPFEVLYGAYDEDDLKGFALDSTSIYFAFGYSEKSGYANGLYREPLGGGDASILHSASDHSPSLDSTSIYFFDVSVLTKIPKAGGTACVVAARPFVGGALVDDSWIYWVETDAHLVPRVMRLPK
jgi:hypothetical protein